MIFGGGWIFGDIERFSIFEMIVVLSDLSDVLWFFSLVNDMILCGVWGEGFSIKLIEKNKATEIIFKVWWQLEEIEQSAQDLLYSLDEDDEVIVGWG